MSNICDFACDLCIEAMSEGISIKRRKAVMRADCVQIRRTL